MIERGSIIRISSVVLVALLLMWGSGASAQSAKPDSMARSPALPGAKRCPEANTVTAKLKAHYGFSDAEAWAWNERLCIGQAADLSRYNRNVTGDCGPAWRPDWTGKQTLSGRFVEILVRERFFREVMPAQGIQIACTSISGTIDLNHAKLERPLALTNSKLGAVQLDAFQGQGDLSLVGSHVTGVVSANLASVNGIVYLSHAQFDGQVLFNGAHITAQFGAEQAVFKDKFQAEAMKVGFDLMLRRGSTFTEVNLNEARVGGQLQLAGATFAGKVDLTGVQIDGELHLADATHTPVWKDGAALLLRNTKTRAFQDTRETWHPCPLDGGPLTAKVDLVGFQYDQAGGFNVAPGQSLADRDVGWLKCWLRLQKGYTEIYTPQPFENLAAVLRRAGYNSKADDVMIALRDYERTHAKTPPGTKAWLWITDVIIGYGYDPWRAMLWLLILTVALTVALKVSLERGPYSYPNVGTRHAVGGIWIYCLDMAVPGLSLNSAHQKITDALGTAGKIGLALYKLAAIALFSFLAAGLSGLVN